MSVDGYLRRLGLGRRPAPTLATLVDLHHRHLDTLAYDNLAIVLGRPDPTDAAATLARIADGGNAGYCFHHNGAVEAVLRELGFDVSRRPGAQLETLGPSGTLDHLVLVVAGLPTATNPGGRWWPDLGYGDGFRDPLPLVAAVHRQGPFRYRVAGLTDRGWTFHHDPDGSFLGTHVGVVAPTDAEVEAAHRRLATPPDGAFSRRLVVQRRDSTGAWTLRGVRLVRTGTGATCRDLRGYDDWRRALVDLGLTLGEVGEAELRALHQRALVDHDDWLVVR